MTVTSDDGSVSHVTADDESFFVDIDTPMVDDIDLQPGSDSGESSSDGITNADSLVFRVDFSEPVVGLGTSDFHANNGADVIGVVEVAAGDGSSYLVTVGGQSIANIDVDITLSVNHTSIYDAAGNQGVSPAGYEVQGSATLDNTGPTVIDIMRPYTNTSAVDTGSSQADGVTNADSLVWVVHTSEPVASGTLTGADFVLTGITPTATPTITVASDPAATAGYER